MTAEQKREATRLRVAAHRERKRAGTPALTHAQVVERASAARTERAAAHQAAQASTAEHARAQVGYERNGAKVTSTRQVLAICSVKPAMTAEEYRRRFYDGDEPRPGQFIRKHGEVMVG